MSARIADPFYLPFRCLAKRFRVRWGGLTRSTSVGVDVIAVGAP